jgi:hypothetical protein
VHPFSVTVKNKCPIDFFHLIFPFAYYFRSFTDNFIFQPLYYSRVRARLLRPEMQC